MKRDRSLRRIEDEKIIRQNKQMEIDLLKVEIENMKDEKHRLEAIIHQYQPHLDLLTQVKPTGFFFELHFRIQFTSDCRSN